MAELDLTALEIFKTVVELGGVNRAAVRLHRVPSNVTTRVKQLERELGVKLFKRERRRLAISAEGQVLLSYADQMLQLASEARAALGNGKPKGRFRIGALESTSAARLPAVLSSYHRLYPDVTVELVTGTSGALVASVQAQEIEAALVAEPFNAMGLDAQLAFVEDIVLITPKTYAPIHGAKDVANRTVIAFANGCSYRRRLETWLRTAKIHVDHVMEFQSYHTIIACVAAGSGIAVVPRSVIGMTSAAGQVQIVSLPREVARANTQLVWRPGYQSVALDALKKLLKRGKGDIKASA